MANHPTIQTFDLVLWGMWSQVVSHPGTKEVQTLLGAKIRPVQGDTAIHISRSTIGHSDAFFTITT